MTTGRINQVSAHKRLARELESLGKPKFLGDSKTLHKLSVFSISDIVENHFHRGSRVTHRLG